MKKMYIVVIVSFLLFFVTSFSLSQNENSDILLSLSNQILNGNEVKVIVWFGFLNSTPFQNQEIKLVLSSKNYKMEVTGNTDENGYFEYIFNNLNEGNYELSAIGNYNGKEFSNFSTFFIEKPKFKIFIEKERYYVNETVSFIINGTPLKDSFIFISNNNLNISFNFKTDENGIYILNQTFEITGKYSARIDDTEVNFEILDIEEKIPELDVEIEKEYFINQTIEIIVKGNPKTNFSLEILNNENNTIYSLFASIGDDGKYLLEFKPLDVGNYTIKLSFENNYITKSFNVKNVEEIKFEILFPKKEFTIFDIVNFTIFGPPNSNFILRIKHDSMSSVYNLSTDYNGKYIFLAQLTKQGNYTVELFYKNLKVIEDTFFVIGILEGYKIDVLNIIQGKAVIDKPVEWEIKINISNYDNSTAIINVSSLNIPTEAKILRLKDENEIVYNAENFNLEILPNQSKVLSVFYETSAPIKIESEPIIINNTWIKKVFISSNSSFYYSNVSVSLEISYLKDARLFLNNEDITDDPEYEVKFYDLNNDEIVDKIEWNIPKLKEITFEIVGIAYIRNTSLNGEINIKNAKDVFLDCGNENIEGLLKEDSYGILVENSVNVTIVNCQVSGFEIGIFIKDSSLIKLINNTAFKNKHGIVFLNSINNTLINNTAENNLYHGILLYSSNDNYLFGNKIKSNFDIKIFEKMEKMKISKPNFR
jgi:parallel beta-helix repeat protein